MFDLDDTLYPEMEFVRSGFWAVAGHVEPDNQMVAYQRLLSILREHGSGKVFDHFARHTGRGLNIPELVELYRYHEPRIGLDVETSIVLEYCAGRFQTALITDGPCRMQRNKFRALQLERWIGMPVFTEEWGVAKPDSRPFEIVMERYNQGEPYLYVADNPQKDFFGPQRLGWRTIRLRRAGGVYEAVEAQVDQEIGTLMELLPLLALRGFGL